MAARAGWFALSLLILSGIALSAWAQEPLQETPARPTAPAAAAPAAVPATPAEPAAAVPATVTVTASADVGAPPDDPVAQLSSRLQQAELKIRRELAESTTVEFVDTPLTDVISFFVDLHQIPIKLQHAALEEAGIAADTPVTCSLANVSLHSVLRVLLEPLDLTYLVDGEVLMIATLAQAQERPEVRVYNVEGIATDKSIDDLIKVITMTCTPESWSSTGGVGQIEKFHGRLVIRQSGEVQWQIARLLADLKTE